MIQTHTINPIFNNDSNVLILGSFPSVKSRENAFYYGHPQNRFWRVLSSVFEVSEPQSIEDKQSFLLANGIALWDVIASCEIEGSSDSSIKNVVVNDISRILSECDIKQIFTNGKTAEKLYHKYILPDTGRECTVLPSTSPANAAYSFERLIRCWRHVRI